MTTETVLIPINKQAKNFLSSGKTIPTLRAGLVVCAEKIGSSIAALEAKKNLQDGYNEIEWKIKATKDNRGQFSVKMTCRAIKNVENLVHMKGLEADV